ncbi:hypothetical protein [Pseudomaricurvus sp. HS19]|uniref:hypothetical protein n=1 Tax=Pseudomaricurvus sp. HS19 TaxID=2692626 RepID=UPI0019253561|nr:hypothetical protein [Pseudomaricurvus sp. HS19]
MLTYLAHMAGAALLVNSVPHSVKGLCGECFPSPFSKPPGVGPSSPRANILWGGINFLAGCGLLFGIGQFQFGLNLDTALVIAAGWGCGFALARHFGKQFAGTETVVEWQVTERDTTD